MGNGESFGKALPLPAVESGRDVERSRRNFEKAAHAVAVLVESVHGLPVPEKTVNQWRRLMGAVRIVDDRIDHLADTQQRLALVGKLRACLKNEAVEFPEDPHLAEAMREVAQLSDEIGDEKAHFLNTLFSLILTTTEEIRSEEDPHNLVRLTMLEGQLTAKLYLPFLPEEFKNGADYQELVRTLSIFGRTANAIDTLIDLPDDYRNEAISIEPTLKNRSLFLGAALANGTSTILRTGLPLELTKQFIWGVIATFGNASEKPQKLTKE